MCVSPALWSQTRAHTYPHVHTLTQALAQSGQVLLVFAVLSVVVLSTLAGVAMGGARLADTGGHVLAGVEVTRINALPPKVPWERTQVTERRERHLVSRSSTTLQNYTQLYNGTKTQSKLETTKQHSYGEHFSEQVNGVTRCRHRCVCVHCVC